MPRLRASCLPALLALVLALTAGPAGATPVRIDREAALDWRLPLVHLRAVAPKGQVRALPRVRLLTKEIVIVPSGRMVIRSLAAARTLHSPARPPEPDPLVLPLPAGLPLYIAALGGVALVARRRRPTSLIAGAPRAL